MTALTPKTSSGSAIELTTPIKTTTKKNK